jgi:HAD superfamily hydrolase (TIGR01509 family)
MRVERIEDGKRPAVVFDLGKVLLDFDFGIAAQRLAPRSRLDPSSFRKALDQSPLLHRYETGELSSVEFFEEVRAAAGYGGTFQEFSEGFSDIFAEISPMIGLQRELNAAGIPTFIFSNTNELATRHIRQAYPFFSGFDGYVLSFEHGVMKPDPRLYEVVERVTGRRGPELIYLDDRAENIDAGTGRGWQAILHHDPALSIPEVRARCGTAPRDSV